MSGPLIKVELSGLHLTGLGADTGINFTQGSRLAVRDCEISGMNKYGIHAGAPNSFVTATNTVLRENGFYGFVADAVLEAVVDGVHAESNGNAGVLADDGAKVTVSNSVISRGAFGAQAAGGSPASDLMITRSMITGASFSLVVAAQPGNIARIAADGVTLNNADSVAFHFAGLSGTEVIYTAGNNTVGFNNGIADGALTPIGTH